jgi:hypothetical protein
VDEQFKPSLESGENNIQGYCSISNIVVKAESEKIFDLSGDKLNLPPVCRYSI